MLLLLIVFMNVDQTDIHRRWTNLHPKSEIRSHLTSHIENFTHHQIHSHARAQLPTNQGHHLRHKTHIDKVQTNLPWRLECVAVRFFASFFSDPSIVDNESRRLFCFDNSVERRRINSKLERERRRHGIVVANDATVPSSVSPVLFVPWRYTTR